MINDNKSRAYLTFMLGEEKFAIHVDNVHEVVELDHFTKVPNTPPYVLGIINLRGSILPLLDTRIKLGLSKAERTNKNRILILDINGSEDKAIRIGAIVDMAREVIEIDDNLIQKPDDIEAFESSTPITGIVNDQGDITMIMDITRVFSFEEINVAMKPHV